ncbi:hypothetical protein GCM10007071_31120 [Marinobacter zhanjiangensis]|uniref:Uncharacterized protein n=1 Tax=Marinobacter zhanjiangensis TaxID=578215 RepID=A0ABQ3B744_9GAMM|nr:hypothetical protein GCM10007071_31120 [Marinobacter zhanjiangensis]
MIGLKSTLSPKSAAGIAKGRLGRQTAGCESAQLAAINCRANCSEFMSDGQTFLAISCGEVTDFG